MEQLYKEAAKMNARPIVCMSNWSKKTLQDVYFQKAKKEGYASRAAYKVWDAGQRQGHMCSGSLRVRGGPRLTDPEHALRNALRLCS